MDIEAATKDLETARQGEEGTPEGSASPPPDKAQEQKIEELELLVGGKPLRLPLNAEIPVKHNGQILKTPLEKLLNSFRQGTHLEDKVKEYKTLREQFEKERGDFDTYNNARQKFGALQDWSEKNPQEWEKLWNLYLKKDLVLGGNGAEGSPASPQVMEYIQRLESKLSENDQRWSTFENQQTQKQLEEDEKVVRGEIETFKKEFPEIDLAEKDLDGHSLTSVIMNHGIKKGIPEFKLAALDYLGPRVVEILVSRGRNEATQAVKRDKQQGIIARGSKPFLGQGSEVDPKTLGEGDRTAAATAELERLLSAS